MFGAYFHDGGVATVIFVHLYFLGFATFRIFDFNRSIGRGLSIFVLYASLYNHYLLRLGGWRHLKGIHIPSSFSSEFLGAEIAQFAITAHDNTNLIILVIDGITDVFNFGECEVIVHLGVIDVQPSNAQMAIAGEVQGLAITVKIGPFLLAFGIDISLHWLRNAPCAIGLT